MLNTNLVPNSRYFIKYDNNKYIGTYKETTNLNETPIYKFEMISEIPIDAPLRPFARSYSFPVNLTTLQPYLASNSNSNSNTPSVLGKRNIQVDDEANKKLKSYNDASKFLDYIQNKIKDKRPLTDEQYEAIPRALSNIPIEEHYRWPEFESLEALDGGAKHKEKRRNKSNKKKKTNKRKKSKTIRTRRVKKYTK